MSTRQKDNLHCNIACFLTDPQVWIKQWVCLFLCHHELTGSDTLTLILICAQLQKGRREEKKKEILYVTLFSCRDAFWALRSGTDHFHVNGYKSLLIGLSWVDLSIYHFPAQNPLRASWNPVKSSLHHTLHDQTQSYPWLLLQSYFLPHLNILLGLYEANCCSLNSPDVILS